ncbi:Tetratricopeptide repeat-containing protein [Lentzea albida]|uniref:Tetratricopeptide repeat-containing protein n=1 Tax=Lentzea albida TaxID=65499 RepID=A0A1H9TAN4_9PSEU|nr:Tetratricopeptide repeat-containing protein [Lentzea albida]
MPLNPEFRGLPAVPPERDDQVVTGLLPHEPLTFQTPEGLDSLNEPVCVVTGQRGVGKTQLAAAYARQRVHDGWLVAWIGAETAGQLAAGLVELADRLGLYRPEDGTEITLARVRNHLRTRSGRALLVFDNVVSLDAVRPHLPSVSTCQVVITTTARGSQLGRDVPVEVFTPEVAARFLRHATGLDGDATELAAELGHLPLALAQAAARIKRARWDYARYLERFREFPAAEHLVRRDGDPYPIGAATAILMALEPFRDSELVRVLSVLSPDGVPRDLLGDDDELLDLHEASLVEFAGDSSVRMHRLVQRVVRDQGDWVALAAGLLLHRVDFDGDELVRQVEALWANTDERQMSKNVLLLRLWEAGHLGSTARFDEAGVIAEEVYAEGLARLGDDEDFLLAARQVASVVGQADLLPRLRIDLVTSREVHGTDHPLALGSARVLAQHSVRKGRAEEAVSVLEQALEPWRGEPVEAEHFGALDDLGAAYTLTGRAAEAVVVLERSLDVRPEALYTQSLLSDACGALGRFADARRLCEEVWDAYRGTAGPGHPATLFAAGKLGSALFLNGEPDLARSLLLVVRAIGTDLLGPDHLVVTAAEGALRIVRQD